jgi:hypothetical protein
MEDLREQKQNQWITTTGDNQWLWTICLDKDNLFNETSTRSLYFVKQKSEQPVTSDANVILDDDRNLYDRYMETAIADLLVLLARRIPQSKREYPTLFNWKEGEDDSVIENCIFYFQFSLLISENHDKHMLKPLVNACKEYLVCKVLEQWYGIDFGSATQERRISHILHYRRKTIARRVRTLL